MAFTNHDYTIGWIAALDVELAAAIAMLEEPLHPDLSKDSTDTNTYTLGSIGSHNIVIAGLPAGSIGNNPAIHSASNLIRSFPKVRFIFMVGIGGGVSDARLPATKDVRLGDIAVSNPDGTAGGVIQYDFGTAVQGRSEEHHFNRKGMSNKPPVAVRTAVTKLRAHARMRGYKLGTYYNQIFDKYPLMLEEYSKPDEDRLFQSDYLHVGGDCSDCLETRTVVRKPRKTPGLVVHYGNIGSANQVLRDAILRDRLYNEENIICFEMEAAGLMDIGCLIIRGICDYCDSHKNKDWQPYASAVAAASAKELLLTIPMEEAQQALPVTSIVQAVDIQTNEIRDQHLTIRSIDAKLGKAEASMMEEKDLQRLRSLKATDSRLDKKRIQDRKGGLLRDSYRWILQNKAFNSWLEQDSGLLWIYGGPGKGKTMLMCGIIDELEMSKDPHHLTVYFFCESTSASNNTAAAVLRGLIHMIAKGLPALSPGLRDMFDRIDGLTDVNSWYLLVEMFEAIIQDLHLIIVIDALDECQIERGSLLRLISKVSATTTKIKWIVSSRYLQEIVTSLSSSATIQIEISQTSIWEAVEVFVDHRIRELSRRHLYMADLQDFLREYLLQDSGAIFLWVSLVCNSLENIEAWDVKTAIQTFPPGLEDIYTLMLNSIKPSKSGQDISQKILAIIASVSRPVSLEELRVLVDMPRGFDTPEWLSRAVLGCGSFVGIRDGIVEFVHETAADFVQRKLIDTVYGVQRVHHQIYTKCMQAMVLYLKRDNCDLRTPYYQIFGSSPSYVGQHIPKNHALHAIRYSCHYWISHFISSISGNIETMFDDDEYIQPFLKTRYIYWLEAMSLYGSLSQAMLIMEKLETLLYSTMSETSILVKDAMRFLLYNRDIIETFPMQLYFSSLLFASHTSNIKLAFEAELCLGFTTIKSAFDHWSPIISQFGREEPTATGESSDVTVLQHVYSYTNQAISGNRRGQVQLFNAVSGLCTHKLDLVYCTPAFTNLDSGQAGPKITSYLISTTKATEQEGYVPNATNDYASTVTEAMERLLDGDEEDYTDRDEPILQDQFLKTWKEWLGFKHTITSIAAGSPRKEIVFVVDRYRLFVWAYELDTLREIHMASCSRSVTLAPNGRLAAYVHGETKVKIFDVARPAKEIFLQESSSRISKICFSPESSIVAAATNDQLVVVWRIMSSEMATPGNAGDDLLYQQNVSCLCKIQLTATGHGDIRLAVSRDGHYVAVGGDATILTVFDADTGGVLYQLNGDSGSGGIIQDFSSPYMGAIFLVKRTAGYILHDEATGHGICSWPPPGLPQAKREQAIMTMASHKMIVARTLASDASFVMYSIDTYRLPPPDFRDDEPFQEDVTYIAVDRFSGDRVSVQYKNGCIETHRFDMEYTDSSPAGVSVLVNSIKGPLYTVFEIDGEAFCMHLQDGQWNSFQPRDCFLPVASADPCCVNPDGTYITYRDKQGLVVLQSTQTKYHEVTYLEGDHSLYGHPRYWSQAGSIVAAVEKPGTDMVLWSVDSGDKLGRFHCEEGQHIVCIEMHPDSKHMVIGLKNRRLITLTVPGCQIVNDWQVTHIPYSIVISSDIKYCACSTDKTIEIWDIEKNSRLHLMNTNLGISLVSVSDDGRMLRTNRGVIVERLGELRFGSEDEVFCHQDWIIKDGVPLILLPAGYRHFHSSKIDYAHGRLCIAYDEGGYCVLDCSSDRNPKAKST